MVYELKEFTLESFTNVLEDIKKRKKKEIFATQSLDGMEYQESVRSEWKKDILAKHYGSLKWDIDGVEFQRLVRNEWD